MARLNSRRKGKGGELEACNILSDALGTVVKRHLGQSREGGCDAEIPPFTVEIKRRAKIGKLYAWVEQALAATTTERPVPVVLCRADGKPWLAVFMLQPDALKFMREAING